MGNIDRRKRGLRAWGHLREAIGILFGSIEKRAGPRFCSPPLWSLRVQNRPVGQDDVDPARSASCHS